MNIEKKISDFIRDAQYRIAELTNEKLTVKRKKPRYVEIVRMRTELITFIGVLWETRQEIKDGSRFLVGWTDGEIESEIDYLRGKAGLNPVPYISFTAYTPYFYNKTVEGAGNLPSGTKDQIITYGVSNQPFATDVDLTGGMGNDSIDVYFANRP